MNPITDTIIQYLTQKTYLFTINKLSPIDHTEECVDYKFIPFDFTIIHADTFEEAMYQLCIKHSNPHVFMDTISRLQMYDKYNFSQDNCRYWNWVGNQLNMGTNPELNMNLRRLDFYCQGNDCGSFNKQMEEYKSTIYNLNSHQKKNIIDKGLTDQIFDKNVLYKALRLYPIATKCVTYSIHDGYYKYTLIFLRENDQMINFDHKTIKWNSHESTIIKYD